MCMTSCVVAEKVGYVVGGVAYMTLPPLPRYGAAYEGTVRNLEYPGQNEAVVYHATGSGSTPMKDGRVLSVEYFTEPGISLAFMLSDYPKKLTKLETKSKDVTIKLARGKKNAVLDECDKKMKLFESGRGETLHGTIRMRYESNTDFEIHLNLTSESGVEFDGVYVSPYKE